MNITIIGGGGFIGINLCEALVSHGHTVRVFDRPRAKHTVPLDIVKQVEWIEGDFLNTEEVNNALHDCEVIFHLVSTTIPKSSNDNPAYDIETNILGSVRMMEAARMAGVRKIIFNSSGGTVYGIPKEIPIPETHQTNPICAYGIGKLAIEKYLALFHYHGGLDYTITRMSNPYGPYQQPDSDQGAITVFLNKALKGEAIEIWGDGSVTRDFIYISDAIDALVTVLDYRGSEHIFNIGSGKGYNLNDIINSISTVLGNSVKCKYLQGRTLDVPSNVLDISRIRNATGWEPKTHLLDGINSPLIYLRQHKQSSRRVSRSSNRQKKDRN
jgi:UDP-glucose 4-epimerase